ncbi:MAG: signal peptidase II [Polyangia bacterium]|nr:signal peptidase II [Polyangia bacterium]
MQLKVKLLIVASAGLLTLAADQATKVWARGALLGPGEVQLVEGAEGKKASIQVIGSQPGVEFRLSFNKGSAFGLFSGTSGARVFLSIIGILALGLIFYLLKRPESDSKVFVYALGFVAGGAVGNLVDRIAFGEVTDFIWMWITPSIRLVWPWPAFNIADIGLVVGVLLMIPAMLFQRVSHEEKEPPKEDDGGSKAKSDGDEDGEDDEDDEELDDDIEGDEGEYGEGDEGGDEPDGGGGERDREPRPRGETAAQSRQGSGQGRRGKGRGGAQRRRGRGGR